MAEAKRKQPRAPRKPKEARTEATAATSEPAADTGSETSNPEDLVTALENAYTRALDERDRTTGTIPAEPLDAVKVAYLGAPKRQRKTAVARLAAKASEVGANGGEHVDLSMGGAVMALTALFAKLDEQDKPTPPPHDPVPGVAGVLSILDAKRAEILAGLSDEQRERIATIDVANDPASQTMAEVTTTAVDKLIARAINGRGRRNSNGHRSSSADTTKRLQEAVASSDKPLTFAEMSEQTGVNTSTLWNRWNAINSNPGTTPGVVADMVNGEKVFKAAD